MAILVGSVEVEVIPTTVNFVRTLRAELVPGAAELGNTLGREIGLGVNQGIRSAVGDPFRNLPGNPGAAGARAGNQFGGKFNDTVQARVRAALASLPVTRLDVNTTEAERRMERVRQKLEALSKKTIGVDIDAAGAEREIARLTEKLQRLNANSGSIQMRVDTAAAIAQLEAIQAEVNRLDGRDVDVDVDVNTNGAVSRIQLILRAIAALGPAIVPAVAIIVAGLGAIGPAAVAAAAGVGVLVLAFKGIGEAVTASNDATKAAAKDAAAAATAQAAAANAVITAQQGVKAATASLANAIAGADSAAVRSADAVAKARAGIGTAARAAAVANAAAARATVAAEQAVTVAVRNSAQAQRDLISARKEAARQLEDLASAQKNGALDERQALLDVADAQDALNLARLDPQATRQSLAAAQVAYERTVQNLDDIRTRNARLAVDKAAADKKGVDGSDLVVDAQQRIIDTAAAETKARQDATVAAQNQARVKVEGAAKVAAAEKAVTDALTAQADQARQSAFAISQGQEALANAQRGLATALVALEQAQAKTSTAADKAAESLAGLSPAGRTFVGFINAKMRPALDLLRKAAQTGLLPGVQAALEALLPFLPGLTDFVARLAEAMGNLFTEAAKALGAPFWQTFFANLNTNAVPILDYVVRSIGNLIGAFAGLVNAFIPVQGSFGKGLLDLTTRFENFSQGLANNAGFAAFIDYVKSAAPQVGNLLLALSDALISIGIAAAPVGTVVVAILDTLAEVIDAIPTPVLTVLIGLLTAQAYYLGLVWAGAKLVAVWQTAATAATKLYNLAVLVANGTARAAIVLNARVAASLLLMAARNAAAAIAIGVMAVAQGVATLATGAWAAAVVILNVALAILTSPITLVVLAIVAVIAIIVLVVKHFDFFKNAAIAVYDYFRDKWPLIKQLITLPPRLAVAAIVAVFGLVVAAGRSVIAWVTDKWPVIRGILLLPFTIAGDLIGAVWGKIRSGAGLAITFVRGKFDDLVQYFKDLPGRLALIFIDLWQGLVSGFKTAINTMIGYWNNLSFTIGGGNFAGVEIPSLTLSTFPDIPFLAAGGVVNGPTVAMIGEQGPEAVVPLNDSRILAGLLGKASAATTGATSSTRGPVTVNQTIVNPLPERASTSGPAALRRAALALGV